MKKIILFISSICILNLGCQQPTTEHQNIIETQPNPEAVVPTGGTISQCYFNSNPQDSIHLSLTVSGKNVTGNLYYQISGKDRNMGELKGSFIGDTLLGDFSFTSEGVTSVREVAFLKHGNDLVEGYGETINEGSKIKFKSHQTLTFGKGIKLVKGNCN